MKKIVLVMLIVLGRCGEKTETNCEDYVNNKANRLESLYMQQIHLSDNLLELIDRKNDTITINQLKQKQ